MRTDPPGNQLMAAPTASNTGAEIDGGRAALGGTRGVSPRRGGNAGVCDLGDDAGIVRQPGSGRLGRKDAFSAQGMSDITR